MYRILKNINWYTVVVLTAWMLIASVIYATVTGKWNEIFIALGASSFIPLAVGFYFSWLDLNRPLKTLTIEERQLLRHILDHAVNSYNDQDRKRILSILAKIKHL